MFFVVKILIAGFIIALASWLSAKKTVLAGFIVALPLVSILSILFAYIEHRNMAKINEFALSIVVAVPLSMAFFVPFLLNKWLKLNFHESFLSGIVLLAVAYYLHQFLLKIH